MTSLYISTIENVWPIFKGQYTSDRPNFATHETVFFLTSQLLNILAMFSSIIGGYKWTHRYSACFWTGVRVGKKKERLLIWRHDLHCCLRQLIFSEVIKLAKIITCQDDVASHPGQSKKHGSLSRHFKSRTLSPSLCLSGFWGHLGTWLLTL